jgi:hypothetical protein
MAWAKPGPGRPKGLANKATSEVRAFVDRVFAACGGEEEIAKSFMHSENEEIRMKIYTLLIAYRYGKPRETIEAHVTIHDELANRLTAAAQFVEQRSSGEYVQ